MPILMGSIGGTIMFWPYKVPLIKKAPTNEKGKGKDSSGNVPLRPESAHHCLCPHAYVKS